MSDAVTLAPETLETTTFNVIISRRANSEILAADDGRQATLPNVSIPTWTRGTPQIAEGVMQLTGLRTVSLFHPDTRELADDQYVVLEPMDSSWQPPAGFRWISRSQIRGLAGRMELATVVESALSISDEYNAGMRTGVFARTGWIDDLNTWVQEQLIPYRLTLTGGFRQLNCGPTFSLVRLETTGPAVWFKAVGEPNQREFPITKALAKHFPIYLPTLIATQSSWNGWLTFEAEGSILDKTSDIGAWRKAARTLADLQMESARNTATLLNAGCRNIAVSALMEQIDPFFDLMAQLMVKQPKVPPQALSSEQLNVLAAQLKETCACLADIGLPETLGHMDFNPGNIIGSSDRCIFLDWAEAYVGHPFFTFEYLREHLVRNRPDQDGWESELTSCYLKPWYSLVSEEQASQALEITPLVAVFAYAVSNDTWQDSQRLQNPKTAGYFRSLTRRMQREARLREERREQCLN